MNRSLFLSLVFATMITSAYATDRVVSPSGLYNSISSAIVASSDGDRILVEPGTYTGHILVDKSISILPNQEGGRYTLSGIVRFASGPASRTMTIIGMRHVAGQMITLGEGGTGRLNIRLIDCFLTRPELSIAPSSFIEMYRDTVTEGVKLANGRIIGNTIGGSTSYNGSLLQVISGSTEADPLMVIGNQFLPTDNGASSPYIMDIDFDGEFHIENNFVANNTGTANFFRMLGAPPIGTPTCTVNSNTFYRGINSSNTVIFSQMSQVTVDLVNNASIGSTGTFIGWDFRTGKTAANLFAAPSWINTSTGQPSLGSPLINAGDPDPRYLDLDLTTNDVGCYGGSNSRANFTTGMGSTVVGFMQAPRVVSQGEPVNISAIGFDR